MRGILELVYVVNGLVLSVSDFCFFEEFCIYKYDDPVVFSSCDLPYKNKLKISLLLLIFCYVKLICRNCKKNK